MLTNEGQNFSHDKAVDIGRKYEVLKSQLKLQLQRKGNSAQVPSSYECIDFTDLNRAIMRNHYPPPTLHDLTLMLSDAKYFSVLSAIAICGYWQVKPDVESSFLRANAAKD